LTLVVADYDEAISFHVDDLGFQKAEDTRRPGGKRWVVVTPTGSDGPGMLL